MKLKLILLLTITFTFIIILTSIRVLAADCVITSPSGGSVWDSTNPNCRCTCTSDAQCIATLTVSAPGLGGYATTTGNACTGKVFAGEIDEQNRYFLTTCDDPSPILNAPFPSGDERLICPNEASWLNPEPEYSPQVRQPICEPERALPGAPSCGPVLTVNGLEISGCMLNENPDYSSQHTEPDCKVCLECSEEVSVEECPDTSCLKWDRRNCYYNPLVTIRPYIIDWDLSGERNSILRGKYYCGSTDQFVDYISYGTPVNPNKPLFEAELSGDTEICDGVNDPDSCKNPCPDNMFNDFYVELDPGNIGTENLEKIIEATGGNPGTRGNPPYVLGTQRGFGDVPTYSASFTQEFSKSFFWGGGGDLGLGFFPVAGTVADAYSLWTGTEFVSGESTAIFGSELLGRGTSLIGLLPLVSGAMIQQVGKIEVPCPHKKVPKLPRGELLSSTAAEKEFIKSGGHLTEMIYYDEVMGYNALGIGKPTKYNAAAFFSKDESKYLFGVIPEGFISSGSGYYFPVKEGKILHPLKPFQP